MFASVVVSCSGLEPTDANGLHIIYIIFAVLGRTKAFMYMTCFTSNRSSAQVDRMVFCLHDQLQARLRLLKLQKMMNKLYAPRLHFLSLRVPAALLDSCVEDFIDSEYLFIVMDILRLLLFIVAARH